MQRLYDAWHVACSFIDGPNGWIVTTAGLVGIAIIVLRRDAARARRMP